MHVCEFLHDITSYRIHRLLKIFFFSVRKISAPALLSTRFGPLPVFSLEVISISTSCAISQFATMIPLPFFVKKRIVQNLLGWGLFGWGRL